MIAFIRPPESSQPLTGSATRPSPLGGHAAEVVRPSPGHADCRLESLAAGRLADDGRLVERRARRRLPILTLMSCPLISLFAFIALSIAAFGLGRPLLRWIGAADDDRLAVVAFSIGLGLTVAGTVLLLLGLAGVLYLPLLGVLTMLCCCWGLVEIGLVWFRMKEPLPAEFPPPPIRGSRRASGPGPCRAAGC